MPAERAPGRPARRLGRLTRDAADRMGRALWSEEQSPAGLSAGEARHASALTKALASGDSDRIRKAPGGPRIDR